MKRGTGDAVSEILSYAYEYSNRNKYFVKLLVAENGTVNPQRRSDKIGSNGYWDYGLCQINKGWHPEIINDKRFFTDWKFQIEKCHELYENGTTFYGKNNIWKVEENKLLTFNE